MRRAMIVVRGSADRARAVSWCSKAPPGCRIEFKTSRRSIPQNSKMWAMLSEVASQLEWHGQKLLAVDWKLLFLDALKREERLVPNLDGTGFVNLRQSSSDLTKSEMSDLIELIQEFGARHNVKFADDPI